MGLKFLKQKILIIFLVFSFTKLYSFDIATHMYISIRPEFVEQWREFDPAFANMIDPSNNTSYSVLVKKFYLLGTTLPDLLDYKTQKQVRHLLNWLYEHRGDEKRVVFNGPLYIDDQIHNLVQDSITFIGDPPNNNLRKLWEMVKYEGT